MLAPNHFANLASLGIVVPHAFLAKKSKNLALELDWVTRKLRMDVEVFASGWVRDCEKP